VCGLLVPARVFVHVFCCVIMSVMYINGCSCVEKINDEVDP